MFWQNFLYYCKQNGKTPNAVAFDIGIKSSGTVTGWKKGAEPRPAVLARLADYFGVSVDELTQEKMSAAENDGQTDEMQLLTYFRQFNREGRGRILDLAESMERSGKYAVGANHFA